MFARIWQKQPESTTTFDSLPDDVVAEIAKRLPVADLIPFLLTSKKTYRLFKGNRLDSLCLSIPGLNEGSLFHATFKDASKKLLQVYFMEQQKNKELWASRKALTQRAALIPASASAVIVQTYAYCYYVAYSILPRYNSPATFFTFYSLATLLFSLSASSTLFGMVHLNKQNLYPVHSKNYYRISDTIEELKRELRKNQPESFEASHFYDFTSDRHHSYNTPTRPIFRR